MFKKLDNSKLPSHVAIIIDGNGRWATKRGLPRTIGHKEGMKTVEKTLDLFIKYNIKFASLFAFSTENWKRDKEEVNGIFDIVRDYLNSSQEEFIKKGIQLRTMGDLTKFPKDLVKSIEEIKEKTKNNDKLILNLALNYGGRADIVHAVNTLISSGKTKATEDDISKTLYSSPLPDPDLVIRTSGEVRISNFMIYQMAYSELYFPKVLWPDFNEKELRKALYSYQNRERRFGGRK